MIRVGNDARATFPRTTVRVLALQTTNAVTTTAVQAVQESEKLCSPVSAVITSVCSPAYALPTSLFSGFSSFSKKGTRWLHSAMVGITWQQTRHSRSVMENSFANGWDT